MEKPVEFQCNICSKRFKYFDDLKVHKFKIHKILANYNSPSLQQPHPNNKRLIQTKGAKINQSNNNSSNNGICCFGINSSGQVDDDDWYQINKDTYHEPHSPVGIHVTDVDGFTSTSFSNHNHNGRDDENHHNVDCTAVEDTSVDTGSYNNCDDGNTNDNATCSYDNSTGVDSGGCGAGDNGGCGAGDSGGCDAADTGGCGDACD